MLNLTAFERVERLLALNGDKGHQVTILSPGSSTFVTDEMRIVCLPTSHEDIVGSGHGVGVLFQDTVNNASFIYTFDTGMDSRVCKMYAKICRENAVKDPVVLCNLGGIDRAEVLAASPLRGQASRPKGSLWPRMFRYAQHMGVLGVELLCEIVRPRALLIGELGLEWKNHRRELVEGLNRILGVPCLLADLGLSVRVFEAKAYAIAGDMVARSLKFDSVRAIYGPNTIYTSPSLAPKVTKSRWLREEHGWIRNLPQPPVSE